MTIKDLEPKIVWENFYSLTQIPRPSKHEAKVQAFLKAWGEARGIETIMDDTGNIIFRKPATPGFENRTGVILQGHMDMVPQKNNDKVHDFENDPIQTVIDGDWVKADGTTLGADNGLGVAMAMAVLESKDIKHGPIEVLVTYDEETGMTGARALKPGVLNGKILINLDSETEGELYVGCAGGLDATCTASYQPQSEPAGYSCYTLAVKGFKGGHSGMDIVLCRANANKIMARVLLPLLENCEIKLIDLEGGTLRNAIPREAFATVYVPQGKEDEVKACAESIFAKIKAEYALADPDGELVFEPYQCAENETCDSEDCKYVDDASALKFMKAILACPDGVERMSDSLPGLVETSNNMAIVRIEKGQFTVKSLMRSSVDSAKDALGQRIKSVFDLIGAQTVFEGGYSGWAPNNASPILKTMKEVYQSLYGKEPEVMAIHAGLECGILGGIYPDWDMVSFGPTLLSPHSPDERAYIPSVPKAWKFLKAVLESVD